MEPSWRAASKCKEQESSPEQKQCCKEKRREDGRVEHRFYSLQKDRPVLPSISRFRYSLIYPQTFNSIEINAIQLSFYFSFINSYLLVFSSYMLINCIRRAYTWLFASFIFCFFKLYTTVILFTQSSIELGVGWFVLLLLFLIWFWNVVCLFS